MQLLIHNHTQQHFNQLTRLPAQAIGIYGPVGAGKLTLACDLVAQILQIDVSTIKSYPYIMVVNEGGIDQVRSIQSFLTTMVPGRAQFRRAVIIESLDQFSQEAQNALLKTLEEPPLDSLIIVTYSQASRIVSTIHSRITQLRVLPVQLNQALDYFGQNYDRQAITRAVYMSDGWPGLLAALLQDKNSHALVTAIDQARTLITSSRFERLASIDRIVKAKDSNPTLLLDGLYRLLNASYKQSLATKPIEQLKPMLQRLKLVQQAMNDIEHNVQAKLVLSSLFIEL